MANLPSQPTVLISSSQRAVRIPRGKIRRLVAFVSRHQGVRLAQVDLAFMDSRAIAEVNRQWLGHVGPTDVISFDLSDETTSGVSAQLVICGDVAARQAADRGIGVQRELMLYVVHGLLHLMGYEDLSVRGAARMRARQEELLDAFLRRRP